MVIPAQYTQASDFKEGLARVQKNGRFGFINKDGKTIIPFRYDIAKDFVNGLSLVERQGVRFYVDRYGNEWLK